MTSSRFVASILLAVAALVPSVARAEEEPVLHFTKSAWPASQEGTIVAGASLRIDYDAERLPQCRQPNSNTAWEIAMHDRFDDGPVATLVVADPGMVLARDVRPAPACANYWNSRERVLPIQK